MNTLEIRLINPAEYDMVKALVIEVFLQYEAPDYRPQGVETNE